jgi:hypothetical protein
MKQHIGKHFNPVESYAGSTYHQAHSVQGGWSDRHQPLSLMLAGSLHFVYHLSNLALISRRCLFKVGSAQILYAPALEKQKKSSTALIVTKGDGGPWAEEMIMRD